MNRLAIWTIPLTLSTSLAACAPQMKPCAKSPAPEAAGGSHNRETDTFNVDYKVTRADGAETVLLAGSSDVDFSQGASIVRSVPGETAEKLHLRAAPAPGGRVAIEVQWQEHGPQGQLVDWASSVVVEPGKLATSKLDLGGGEGRKLSIGARALDRSHVVHAGEVSSLP